MCDSAKKEEIRTSVISSRVSFSFATHGELFYSHVALMSGRRNGIIVVPAVSPSSARSIRAVDDNV